MAQQVDNLNAGDTALRFLPMGAIGFVASMGTGKLLEYVNGKYTLLAGLILTVVAPIPSALTATNQEPDFWVNVLPASLISITAVSLIFVTTSTLILTTVPVNVKSLCGGMVSSPPHLPNLQHTTLTVTAEHRIPNRLWSRAGHLSRSYRRSRHFERPRYRAAVLYWSLVLRRPCWPRTDNCILFG